MDNLRYTSVNHLRLVEILFFSEFQPNNLQSDNRSEIAQSAISGAMLHLENLTGNESGLYQCSAVNILGQAQSLARLEVNRKLY